MLIEITLKLETPKLASNLLKYAKPLVGMKGDYFELIYADKVKERRPCEFDGSMRLLKERDSVCFRVHSDKAVVGPILELIIGNWMTENNFSIDQPWHKMREVGPLEERMLLPGTKIVGIYYDSNFPKLGDIYSGYLYTKKGGIEQ